RRACLVGLVAHPVAEHLHVEHEVEPQHRQQEAGACAHECPHPRECPTAATRFRGNVQCGRSRGSVRTSTRRRRTSSGRRIPSHTSANCTNPSTPVGGGRGGGGRCRGHGSCRAGGRGDGGRRMPVAHVDGS